MFKSSKMPFLMAKMQWNITIDKLGINVRDKDYLIQNQNPSKNMKNKQVITSISILF